MFSLNTTQLIGNLGSTPEITKLDNGQYLCKVSIATSESYKNNDDEWVEKTEWHNLVFWGKKAEYLAEKAKKGDTIYVEGKHRTNSFTNKENVKQYSSYFEINKFKIVQRTTNTKDLTPISEVQATVQNEAPVLEPSNDDLPF